jgi:N-acetylmuramoyl-L-alanine amidase
MYKIYNVQNGDNIDMIAKKVLSTSEDIRKINGFDFDYDVEIGEQLVVPAVREQLFDIYTVMKGDTLYDISRRYNVSVDNLALLNGLEKNDYIYPGQEMLVPKAGIDFYVTQNGDTLFSVTEHFNIPLSVLMEQNQIIYLLPDQLLVYKKEK